MHLLSLGPSSSVKSPANRHLEDCFPLTFNSLYPSPLTDWCSGPKRYSPRSLPFCSSSVFGNSWINAVSELGVVWGCGTVRYLVNYVQDCVYHKQGVNQNCTVKQFSLPFYGHCNHTNVKDVICQLFLHGTTGIYFHNFRVFLQSITSIGSVSPFKCRAINICQRVQRVNGRTF